MIKKISAFIFLAIAVLLIACGGKKKKSMAGDEGVQAQEFADFFPDASLPFVYSDSLFPKKENDSLRISAAVYHQFIPDSVDGKVMGKNSRPQFYAVAKITADKEIYFLSKGITENNKTLFINVFDKKEYKFIAGMPLIKIDKNAPLRQILTIDPKLNISKVIVRRKVDGSTVSGQDVYILNHALRRFTLIMTDSLGDGVGEFSNPIDTLPARQKYSGDYSAGKGSLVSIRDGKHPQRLSFFIYIQSSNSECMGELKGEAVFTSPTVAEYRQGGDPCVLRFAFEGNQVTLTEVEGCGSRLGNLQCSFNGSYKKKKEAKKTGMVKK